MFKVGKDSNFSAVHAPVVSYLCKYPANFIFAPFYSRFLHFAAFCHRFTTAMTDSLSASTKVRLT